MGDMDRLQALLEANPQEALRLLQRLKKKQMVPHSGGQQEVYNSTARFKVLNAGRRWGKFLWTEERVLTPQGWRRFGSLKEGDEVTTRDGAPTKVTGVFPQGKKRGYRVTFSDGASVVSGLEHLWTVYDAKGHEKTVPLRELLADYKIKRADGRVENRYAIPTVDPVQYDPPGELPAPPWALGALLGDGCLPHSAFTTADTQMVDRLRKELAILGCEVRPRSGYDYGITGLKPVLRDLGIIDCRSWDKVIPDQYMRSRRRERLELLRGLLDTDGNVDRGRAEFSSASRVLAEQVVELVRGLGGIATLRVKKTTHRDAFVVRIRMKRCPFWLQRKADKWRPGRITRKIVSIVPTANLDMLCIKVDAADGLFVTTDYVVTHNTELGAKEIIKRATAKPDQMCWWTAPTYRVVKRGYNKILDQLPRELLTHDPSQDTAFDAGRAVILKFKNGSRIELYSAERPGGMLGEGVDFALLDEAATMPANTWEQVIRPTLSDKKGGALLISTPRARNWFYKRWQYGQDPQEPEWSSWTFPSITNPYLEDSEIAAAKKELPRLIFEQEYEAKFIAAGSSVFLISDPSIQKHPVRDDGLVQGVLPKGHVVLGIDLAKTQDFTVIYGARASDRKNVYFERLNSVTWGEQKRRIARAVSTLRNAGASAVTLVMDSTGVGDPIVEDMDEKGFDVVPINFTTHKANMVKLLAKDLEDGRAYVLEEGELDEFHNYAMNVTPGGKFTFSAPEGEHDDAVSAKMLQHHGLVNEGVPGITTLSSEDPYEEVEPLDAETEDVEDEASWSDLVDADDWADEFDLADQAAVPRKQPTPEQLLNNPEVWSTTAS